MALRYRVYYQFVCFQDALFQIFRDHFPTFIALDWNAIVHSYSEDHCVFFHTEMSLLRAEADQLRHVAQSQRFTLVEFSCSSQNHRHHVWIRSPWYIHSQRNMKINLSVKKCCICSRNNILKTKVQ